MNDFVEECRREWKRLRVPDAVADGMAAELADDLRQAEAEGAKPEDVIGTGALDPRAFARAWAAERGTVPPERRVGKALAFTIFAVLVALVASGAVLLSTASSSTANVDDALMQRQAALSANATATGVWITQQTGNATRIDVPSRFAVIAERDEANGSRTAGLVLLIVGLAGLLPLAAFALARSYKVGTRSA